MAEQRECVELSFFQGLSLSQIASRLQIPLGTAKSRFLYGMRNLRETFGVIVYQEQVMQAAQILAGYSLGEADLLRRAMGSKRGIEKIETLKAKLYEGMATNGITGADADTIYAVPTDIAIAPDGYARSRVAASAPRPSSRSTLRK
mgnify:CR=1 FL=1